MDYKTPTSFKAKLQARREMELEGILRKLSSIMTQAAAGTASAFFSANTSPGPRWQVPPFNDLESLHCSQRNMGEKFEMTCNLAVAKTDWDRMFPAIESDRFKMDTFCELANCICGTVLAQPEFSQEFGNMIPCVPFSMAAQAVAGSKTLRGAFRLSGILVYFSFTVVDALNSQESSPSTYGSQSLSVAA
jgi:hypothetical protein